MKLNQLIVGILSVLGFLLFSPAVFASTLTLSPGSGSIGVGSTLAVTVRLGTGGEGVNGVSAYLAYPTDKLDVSYVRGSGTFNIEAENSFGGGGIRISRGSINAVSGNVSVATIGFRGKALGSATVAFIGGSAAPRASDSSDSLDLGSSRGGTFNIVASLPKASAKPGQAAQPSDTQDQTTVPAPIISDIKFSKVATNSATISWKTDRKALSQIDYGLEKDRYFLNASDGSLVTDHSLKLEGPLLTPGIKLHLKVSSKDDGGILAQSEDMILQLLGYKVKIKFVDANGQPLKQVQVSIYSDPQTGTTDANGEVTFDNINLGKHLVVVKEGVLEKTAEIEVKDNASIQNFDLKTDLLKTIPQQRLSLLMLGLIAVIGIIILLISVIIWKKKRDKNNKPADPSGMTLPMTPQQ
jgi:hypothetical protein